MEPSSLRPLLDCILCRRRLAGPTTLHCGHTLCARHLSDDPSCPVPRCNPASTANPSIPVSSAVAYYPPSTTTDFSPSPLPLASRTDVTLTKVLDLLDRVQAQLSQADRPRAPPQDDSDLSDDDVSPPDFVSEPSSMSSTVRVLRRRRAHSSPGSPTERSRKRRRRVAPSQPQPDENLDDDLHHVRPGTQALLLPPARPPVGGPASRESILAVFEKDLLAEFTCEICFTLLYEPVTTRCQHTFCSRCLHRSLDHSPSCPLCRQDLPPYIYEYPKNKVILSLLLEAFPTRYQELKEIVEAEDRDARVDTPIFVCQLSFPGCPTLLHIFEPRYRLMLRRCLEFPKPCFGMIAKSGGAGSPQTEYGTMLEIRSVKMEADGRSLVETWGTYRFRILERRTVDGYMVGRIERIDDDPEDLVDCAPLTRDSIPTAEPSEAGPSTSFVSTSVSSSSAGPSASTDTRRSSSSSSSSSVAVMRNPSNTAVMGQCREFLSQLERGTAPWIIQRYSDMYGRIPTDVATFSFWVASVLPIDEHEKAKLLPIRSPRLRLLLVSHWIEQLNKNWWFSSGCVVH